MNRGHNVVNVLIKYLFTFIYKYLINEARGQSWRRDTSVRVLTLYVGAGSVPYQGNEIFNIFISSHR